MFQVFDVTQCAAIRPEILGSKEKEWIIPSPDMLLGDRHYLFKIGRRGTGENWAEKVTSEIAKTVGLPCAHYELAIRNGERGVISEQLMPSGASLALGNLLLPLWDQDYVSEQKFHQTQYRLSTVLALIDSIVELGIPPGKDLGLTRPVDFFVGYLVFDALIANTDRHHENWGIVVERDVSRQDKLKTWLAPSFDHASSLGRSESDEKRTWRLTTKDQRADVKAYAKRAKTAFYGRGDSIRTLTTREVLVELNRLFPVSSAFWSNRICNVSAREFVDLLNEIPDNWISVVARNFAVEMLKLNQETIAEVTNG